MPLPVSCQAFCDQGIHDSMPGRLWWFQLSSHPSELPTELEHQSERKPENNRENLKQWVVITWTFFHHFMNLNPHQKKTPVFVTEKTPNSFHKELFKKSVFDGSYDSCQNLCPIQLYSLTLVVNVNDLITGYNLRYLQILKIII